MPLQQRVHDLLLRYSHSIDAMSKGAAESQHAVQIPESGRINAQNPERCEAGCLNQTQKVSESLEAIRSSKKCALQLLQDHDELLSTEKGGKSGVLWSLHQRTKKSMQLAGSDNAMRELAANEGRLSEQGGRGAVQEAGLSAASLADDQDGGAVPPFPFGCRGGEAFHFRFPANQKPRVFHGRQAEQAAVQQGQIAFAKPHFENPAQTFAFDNCSDPRTRRCYPSQLVKRPIGSAPRSYRGLPSSPARQRHARTWKT